jgi:small-conductance mechanosensitive channel
VEVHSHGDKGTSTLVPAVSAASELWGVRLLGVDAQTGTKLLLTLALVGGVALLRVVVRRLVAVSWRGRRHTRGRFWARQGTNLATAVVVALGLVSIWFDSGLHAAAGVGLLSAAVVFAMQKAVTAVAGYFLILRGNVFAIGDRIVMGGVRGDVIALGFLRTTILEMGQPRGDDDQDVPVWVDARQYTGRVVTVTNGAVFDEPVYNYSRDFPFLWEELSVGIKFDADRVLAEQILLEAAQRHARIGDGVGPDAMRRMARRFYVPATDLEPEVYVKLADSWVQLTVRFVVPTHGIRRVKSDITRDVLDGFAANGIDIAYNAYAISEVPPLRVAGAYPSDDAVTSDRSRASRR